MAEASAMPTNFAKNPSGALCSEPAGSVRLTIALSDKARKIFSKPYRALVDILQVSERDAHYRLSAERKYTASDIAKLLQSEQGIQFLVILMDRARPRWWRAILKMGVLGSIEQRRQEELKLMRRVFDADEASSTTFSDSFRAQEPHFFSAVLAGFDELAMPGVADSSVGKEKRR